MRKEFNYGQSVAQKSHEVIKEASPHYSSADFHFCD